ncbi:MAG: enoyl-CoA hydratase/isomerase family protein [Planctomycetota bacterium]|jgi:methylglutaconyl-CoA hydratase
MSEPVLLKRDEGPLRWLTLNRPRSRNALSAEMVAALKDALANGASGPRCIVITGAGSAFSAGADLKALQAMRTASYEENLADSRHLAELFEVIATLPLPLVAAVNGHAMAGGAGLAVACDLTVAAKGALFGFTETRIGFVPAIVMNFLLRTVGEKVARDLCLTGRRLPVEEACAMGLIGRVVEPEALAETIRGIGESFAATSPEAVATTKRLFLELRGLPLEEGLEWAAQANARARATDDCREGIAAFLEKRNPRWNERRT